jgi:hypothetical protein
MTETPETPTGQADVDSPRPLWLTIVLLALAVVILIAFVILAISLLHHATRDSQTTWERRVYIFSAVEAIAFTAVGWLFGREVNAGAAKTAQTATATARAKTAEAAGEKAKGAALASAILSANDTASAPGAAAGSAPSPPSPPPPGPGAQALGVPAHAPPVTEHLASLTRLARNLYPEQLGD